MKKKKKNWKRAWDRYQKISEKEKEKKVKYMKNYYLPHKNCSLAWFVDFWGPGVIFFYGLVFEIKKILNFFLWFGGFLL